MTNKELEQSIESLTIGTLKLSVEMGILKELLRLHFNQVSSDGKAGDELMSHLEDLVDQQLLEELSSSPLISPKMLELVKRLLTKPSN
jgi:hypothetical protein